MSLYFLANVGTQSANFEAKKINFINLNYLSENKKMFFIPLTKNCASLSTVGTIFNVI
jgi:hypothetical protein